MAWAEDYVANVVMCEIHIKISSDREVWYCDVLPFMLVTYLEKVSTVKIISSTPEVKPKRLIA